MIEQQNEKHKDTEDLKHVFVVDTSSYKTSLIKLFERLPELTEEEKNFISFSLKFQKKFDESISINSNLMNLVKSYDEEQCKLFFQFIGLPCLLPF